MESSGRENFAQATVGVLGNCISPGELCAPGDAQFALFSFFGLRLHVHLIYLSYFTVNICFKAEKALKDGCDFFVFILLENVASIPREYRLAQKIFSLTT